MVELWWQQAEEHGVLPLDDRTAARAFRAARRPGLPTAREVFVYYPPVSHIVSDACPSAARGWTTQVDLEHPQSGGDGALVNRGTINSGFAFYILGGRLHFDYNCFHAHTKVSAPTALAGGEHVVAVQVERLAARRAAVRLLIDGEVVADGEIPLLLGMLSSTGMDLGRANRAGQPGLPAALRISGKDQESDVRAG